MNTTKYVLLFCCLSLVSDLDGQNLTDSLTQALQNHYDKSDLPGFSVAIVNENEVLYEEGFGYADKESKMEFSTSTVENLASVSKTVVGLALVKAIENEQLSLDSEISDFLSFDVVNPFHPNLPILIRHLVTHTSSIQDTKHYMKSYVYESVTVEPNNTHQDYLKSIKSHEKMPLEEFLAKILDPGGDWYSKNNYLKAEPGVQYEYANLNAALVALILESATGVPFREYSRSTIIEPLNMNSTTWSVQNVDPETLAMTYFPNGQVVPRYSLITYPDGGLYSCVNDLSLYLMEMMKAYAGNSKYLPPEFARLLLPGDDDENRVFWGMGKESRNIGHGGSDPGVQTDLQFNADSRIGRIIITNVNAGDNEKLWEQYRQIHSIMERFEVRFND